ncbi:hypothetical protein [Thermogemmatispora sp.]|uniref:hypothetical protein n=1 Tax=Thermogemmatispora sp. TaxID=1968838 RepID=UPI0035E44FAC
MRYTVVLLALAFFLFLSAVTAKGGEAAAVHGCASPVPLPISGAQPPPLRSQAIVLNEVLTRPASAWNCSSAGTPTLNRDAWVELYNPLDQPIDLYAVHAALDTGPQTTLFLLPLSSALPAHGFLVVFPDSQLFFPNGPFTLRLLFNGSAVIDAVNVPQLNIDESFARTSDGAAVWHSTTDPTPGASNAPVPQPSPQATPRATATAPTSASPGRTSAGETVSATPASANAGTQPDWNALRLPSPSPATANMASSQSASDHSSLSSFPSSSTSPQTEGDSTSGPGPLRLALLIGLALALAASCLWCWRLFRSPPHGG